jgi:endonuclease YncB( thermonuclease family)
MRAVLQPGIALLGSALLFATAPAQAADSAACQLPEIGIATVRVALDGRTLGLDDGREIRLAGIEVPQSADAAAQAALQAMLGGRQAMLLKLGPETDRYGRQHATVSQSPAAGSMDAQYALLAQGHALVAKSIENSRCAAVFLSAENAARIANRGLWAASFLRTAENPAGILEFRGRFAVVEGKVLSVRESNAVFYVNFGRRWSEDFTVTVPKRLQNIFTAGGLDLKKLAGRHVRVRGIVEERGGPWIEATHPGQIEIVERL